MLNAIADKAEQEEQRSALEKVADARYAKVSESGETISWPPMRNYLESRLTDAETRNPPARNAAR